MKNILKVALLIIMVLTLTLAFVSCNDNTGEGSGDGENAPYDYTVTIKDGSGAPIKGIIIKLFDSEGSQVGANVTGATGKVTFSDITDGEYTIKLNKGVTKLNFSITDYNVTATSDGYTITLHNEPKETMTIYGASLPEDAQAYVIGSGSYRVTLAPGEMNYFVFHADESGVYSADLISDNADLYMGYYGIPMFVQDTHRIGDSTEAYDGKGFELEIPDVATPYVIGIKSTETTECIFNIVRKSDLPFRPEYMAITEVKAYANLSKYTLPDGATLGEFDITDRDLEIVLGENGKYYTQDGKLIVLRIATPTKNPAMFYSGFASLMELAGLSNNTGDGENAGSSVGGIGMNIGGYIYDGEGNIIAHNSYNGMIETYLEYCDDKTGVYPLTEELLNMLKVHGGAQGWWEVGTIHYLFNTDLINTDMAWLFMCSYVNQ